MSKPTDQMSKFMKAFGVAAPLLLIYAGLVWWVNGGPETLAWFGDFWGGLGGAAAIVFMAIQINNATEANIKQTNANKELFHIQVFNSISNLIDDNKSRLREDMQGNAIHRTSDIPSSAQYFLNTKNEPWVQSKHADSLYRYLFMCLKAIDVMAPENESTDERTKEIRSVLINSVITMFPAIALQRLLINWIVYTPRETHLHRIAMRYMPFLIRFEGDLSEDQLRSEYIRIGKSEYQFVWPVPS